jgi:hypothetical protein
VEVTGKASEQETGPATTKDATAAEPELQDDAEFDAEYSKLVADFSPESEPEETGDVTVLDDDGKPIKAETEEKPEEPKEPEQPEIPPEEDDLGLEPLPPEHVAPENIEKMNREFAEKVANEDRELIAKFQEPYAKVLQRREAIDAEIANLKAGLKDEDEPSGRRQPTIEEIERIQQLHEWRQETVMAEQHIGSLVNQVRDMRSMEAYRQHVLNIDPRLKPYESEFRQATDEGIFTKTTEEMIALCRARRVLNGGQVVSKTKAPKPQEVEQRVIEERLARKDQATIGAGSKGAPSTAPKPKAGEEWRSAPKKYHDIFERMERTNRR